MKYPQLKETDERFSALEQQKGAFKYKKKEHIAKINYNRKKNQPGQNYSKNKNIIINFKESKVIFPSKQYHLSIVKEAIVITTRKNSICNNTKLFNLPHLRHELLSGFKKQKFKIKVK